jgi:hypothetical protein
MGCGVCVGKYAPGGLPGGDSCGNLEVSSGGPTKTGSCLEKIPIRETRDHEGSLRVGTTGPVLHWACSGGNWAVSGSKAE